ncbi:acid phosphatase PHOa [Delitschia confertaspora ATCC 74209]|uniref:acid phosphatase n=1 Tax=Delitschia confertaspora ATCC 74209 TaxID=1513339 RepID=A0A9P4JL03_9PLEO|nr:acid phosphatase PHOa [Delitschia confertaspora ATCC 74209]
MYSFYLLLSASLLWVAHSPKTATATTTHGRRPKPTAIQPSPSEIAASKLSAPALSPTSSVEGKAFNRIIQIWLENTDYDLAASNPDMKWLANQGITLTNFWALTHPSQSNYAAAVSGDHFGMDHDEFVSVPANVSTVVDLLDTKGISWGEYQEGLPYAGFQGKQYSESSKNSYVRKHNPLIMYESVTLNATRLSLIKNFTSFDTDLAEERLPQWSFITPNMTNDGHDSSLDTAAKWARSFLEPLLKNDYVMKDTLILLTFDENHSYSTGNRIFSLMLGGAVPQSLRGKEDNTFYNHYSTISSISFNWALPSLGRWDCGANIFALLANQTNSGIRNWVVNTTAMPFSTSYPGPLSNKLYIPTWPQPTTGEQRSCVAKHGVLESVKRVWEHADVDSGGRGENYSSPYPWDGSTGYNNGANAYLPSKTDGSKETPTGAPAVPAGSPSESPKGNGGVNEVRLGWVGGVVLSGVFAAVL